MIVVDTFQPFRLRFLILHLSAHLWPSWSLIPL